MAQDLAQQQAFWQLRENISEAQRIEGLSIKHDISVPVSRIAEFIARADAALARAFPAVRIVTFGHIGDGNLHYNLSRPEAAENAEFIAQTPQANRIVHDLVAALGGSISAEHGLGQLKRTEILRYKSAVEMDLMRAVKQALDPARPDESGQGALRRSGGFTRAGALRIMRAPLWGYSSAGRALAWHARGQRFDPAYLHHKTHQTSSSTSGPHRLEA